MGLALRLVARREKGGFNVMTSIKFVRCGVPPTTTTEGVQRA